MNAHANKSQENNNQAAVPSASQSQGGGEGVFQFIDDRPENASQQKLQELADNTPQATQFKFLQNMANQRSETSMLAQLQTNADIKSLPDQVTQLEGDEGFLIDKLDSANEAVQLVADKNIDTDKPALSLQKSGETNTTQLAKGAGASSGGGSSQGNSTGMPDNLKAGVESLSGMSMDHVKVHRNSDKPAQLNAHAYAQGSDIHVGPGQEKHLPHEAWHVVQQAQGRVQPTRQMKGKVNINDDTGLEKEADVMGAKALKAGSMIQRKFSGLSFSSTEQRESNNSGGVVQGLFGLSNPFSGLFGGEKKTNEKDGAAANKVTVADVAKPEETVHNDEIEDNEEVEEKEKIGEEKDAEEPTSPVVNESEKTYKYRTQYWVTEPETLRATDKIQAQTTAEKNNSKADAELMLNKGKTKSAGMLDSILGVVGLGKQESLLGPKLDPKKNKFYYPAMVDETSKISKKWKPIKIRVPSNPNEKFKSKYASLKKVDGFYPITKMVAMPFDYNAFLDLQSKKKEAEAESKNKASETSIAEGSSASTENAKEQNIVKEAGEISGATSAPAEASVEAPTKENELQEDVEKAEEGKLDLFKKYGKRIFTFATKFSFVRVWINDNLQAGGSAFNELALKAKESAKSIPLLGSLTLVTKPEGTRVTPEGVTFNFGVKFPIGDKEVELSTQLFTDTQSDYSTSYIGSSAKGIAFSIGADGDGPKFETNLGTITHDFSSDSSSYITSTGGSASLSWGAANGSIKWNSLSFSAAQTPKLKGDISSIAMGLDIFGSKANFEISNPSLADKKLTFTEAKATLDKFEPFSGFEVGPTDVTLTSTDDDYDLNGSTKFNFSNKLVTNASGNIFLSRIDEEINLIMTDGHVNVQFNDKNNLSINNINYDYQEEPYELSANNVTSNFDIPNPISSDKIVGNITIDSPKINEEGFAFYSGTLTSQTGVGLFDQLQIKNIVATTNHRKFEGSAQLEKHPSATHVKEAVGNLSVAGGYKESSRTHFILNEGSMKVDFLGQSVSIAGIKYDNIKSPTKVSAETAALSLDFNNPIGAGGVKATGTITKPEVSSKGFGFTTANVVSNAPINLFNALTFNDIDATIKQDESYNGQGDFSVTPGDIIKDASGKVSVSRAAGKDAKTNYTLSNGALGVAFLGQTIAIAGVNYDSKADATKVSADTAVLNLDFNNPIGAGDVKATGTITKPHVSSKGFGFEKANVVSNAPINLFNALTFDNINATLSSDGSYGGQGDFSATQGSVIKTASGKVSVSRAAAAGSKTKYSLTDGALTVDFGLGLVSLSGVNYSSDKPGEFGMNNANLTTNILGNQVTLGVEGAKVLQEGGFDYVKVGGTLSDLSFGEAAKFSNIEVSYEKATKTLTGTTAFNLQSGFGGFAATTTGNVTVSKNDKGSSLTLAGASLTLTLGSQKLELKEMNYAESMLSVGKSTLEFNVFEKKLVAEVTDGTVSKDGFNYSSASLALNSSINFGIGKATIGTVTATKTDEGTTISGDGSLSVGGGTVLGISLPELSGKGVISHTFPKGGGEGETKKELTQVGGKLPDIRLPEALLPAGWWPFSVDIPIPVAPGVSVNIFAGLKGYLSLNGTEITVTKKEEGVYIFNARLNKAKAELAAAVGAGVMVGNPLVASMMLGIEAAGGVDATFDASFSKEIDTNDSKKLFTLGETESDYEVKGDIKLSASLVLEGRALYFLKKRKEKLLGEKILGSFEGKKGQDFKFIKPEEALMSKEDHANEAKEMLPASFASMTLEELKVVPQDKRFSADETDKAVEGLATAAGGDSNKKVKILGDFLYDRVDFDKLNNALSQFAGLPLTEEAPKTPAPETTASETTDPEKTKDFFTKVRESRLVKVAQDQLELRGIRDHIGESINLKAAMVTSYSTAIRAATTDNAIKEDHLKLYEIYEKLNLFKKNFHSGLIGDGAKAVLSGAGSSIRGFFGGTTLEADAKVLLTQMPILKETKNRLDSIKATVAAPSPSPSPRR